MRMTVDLLDETWQLPAQRFPLLGRGNVRWETLLEKIASEQAVSRQHRGNGREVLRHRFPAQPPAPEVQTVPL